MEQTGKHRLVWLAGFLAGVGLILPASARGQGVSFPPATPAVTVLPGVPAATAEQRALPINLIAALQLANANAADIALASQRIQTALAILEQAQVLWLPTVTVGGDYNRHDGRNQDTTGKVFDNSRSSMMFGAGTGIGQAAVLNVNEAIFAPLVAKQQVRARQADLQAVSNDTLVAVTDAYFNVQQARGELAGAVEATRRTAELVERTKKLAPALVAELEISRVETELARRQQAELTARERWGVAGAELLRVLRLDPGAQVEPTEPPHLRVDVIPLDRPLDELIALALTSRPELTSQQAQVQATLQLLKQEKLRPLIPSVLLRGFSTPVTGTLATGIFAGGPGGSVNNPGWRVDLDLQVLWQFDNLGFGNRGRIRQRESENQEALIALFRLEDRVAAEVAQAYTQLQMASRRVSLAEKGVRAAVESADKNRLALREPQPVGGKDKIQLVVRPQEVVAAVQALAQAYLDYYGAVADANRAQFRLYRALGQPAKGLNPSGCSQEGAVPAGLPATVLDGDGHGGIRTLPPPQ
jgi:outer membrane protein TolC